MRKAPFGKARLLDDDVMVDFSEVTTPNDKVSVIATLPLTRDETWSQLAVNELVMFQDGDIVLSDRPDNPVYMSAEEGLEIARAVGVSVLTFELTEKHKAVLKSPTSPKLPFQTAFLYLNSTQKPLLYENNAIRYNNSSQTINSIA